MKLRKWLYDNHIQIKDFATLLSLNKGTIFAWLNGSKTPSHTNRTKVAEVTKGKVKKTKDFVDKEKAVSVEMKDQRKK